MSVAAIRRMVTRLEALAAARPPAPLPDPLSPSAEEHWREIHTIHERVRKRRRAIDTALASGDPEAQATARRSLEELKGDARAEARREELRAILEALQRRYPAPSAVWPCPGELVP